MNFYDILLARCLCCNSDDACPCPKSSSGDIITITDGSDNTPLKSAVVNIEPVQDLHGYDYPWPAGGGKNKLNVSSGTGAEMRGVNVTYDNAGGLTYSGTTTTNGFIGNWTLSPALTLPAGTYTFSIGGTITQRIDLLAGWTSVGYINADSTSNTFTLSEAKTIDKVVLNASAAGLTININVKKIQIESGSTATAWQPYSNICPISGWTQVNVKAAGENLFDKATGAKDLYVGGGNRATTGAGGTLLCFYAKKGVQYTLNATGGNRRGLFYYDTSSVDDIVAGLTLTLVTWSAATPYTFIAEKDAVYCFYANTDYEQSIVDSCTVNAGSAALPYSSYVGTPITIPLGQTVYGGTLDVVSRKLVVDRAIVDLGNLEWVKSPNGRKFYASLPQYLKDRPNENYICTRYKFDGFVSSSPYYGENGTFRLFRAGGASAAVYEIYIHDENYNDAVTFKSAMSEVQLLYAATPIEVDLTPQTITTLLGTNNIWADAGEMTIEYYPAAVS